jgi:hypothetical protein
MSRETNSGEKEGTGTARKLTKEGWKVPIDLLEFPIYSQPTFWERISKHSQFVRNRKHDVDFCISNSYLTRRKETQTKRIQQSQ